MPKKPHSADGSNREISDANLRAKLAFVADFVGDRPQPRPFSDGELDEIGERSKRLSEIAAQAKRLSQGAAVLRMAKAPRDIRRYVQTVTSAVYRLVEAFNPGGRFGSEPFPDVPALFRPQQKAIGGFLERIRMATREIANAVEYNLAAGYGPKIGQVADEYLYALVEGIRTTRCKQSIDDLATAAVELLAELDVGRDRDAWIYREAAKGTKWAVIMEQLRQHTEWRFIETVPGLRAVADRYAKKTCQPLPRRR